ncbi:hypothetical protein VOLCADRAFT_101231 [Volvox carteri f. nagariensis]|uniref:Uncharacterized protein n=1 Tax=Volvox carteri f. nagariensis TaxID=3068 RepID=D8UM29_VOLCA|nr:uncharacterized protein VOLCADRAFT_101231 [Volvox carteri f. nagariensis]EFJ39221.1 hypothetical protein VOLCADRAFT_101231 [Volvox carteri f. nagariensis]|eukprot:XP_002959715.1 hypothetical protein VOLCADRAFT_101231 [Volvox carteri f. nagariensis]
MGDGVEAPAPARPVPTSGQNGGQPHLIIAFSDETSTPQSDLNRGPQNSALKRVQTNANILRTIDKRAQVIIRFENVCAWVPTLVLPGGQGRRPFFSSCVGKRNADDEVKPQAAKERQILFNISGEVNPGEVGKETLLWSCQVPAHLPSDKITRE